jgi:reactive intermediate/imine deaminase
MSGTSDEAGAFRDGPFFAPRGPRPVGPYPHARRFGNLLFVSGIGPRHPETDAIGDGIEAQTRGCIENVKAILEDAGTSLDRVIDVTVFLTDMAGDFAAYNRVYGEYFGAIAPSRTTVGVVALPTAISIELKVIAEAPAASRSETPSSP